MSFLAALQFLTSIPVSIKRKMEPAQIGRATMWFPLIGFIIGLVLALLNLLLGLIFPASVVNVLLIVAMVIITGALHLDGFADTCDGIAGHKPVEERWKVMHDSRTGAFGVVGVALLLLVKYVALNNVPEQLVYPCINHYACGQPLGDGLRRFRFPLRAAGRTGHDLQTGNALAAVYSGDFDRAGGRRRALSRYFLRRIHLDRRNRNYQHAVCLILEKQVRRADGGYLWRYQRGIGGSGAAGGDYSLPALAAGAEVLKA